MPNAYKFAHHDRVPAEPPEVDPAIDKAFGDDPLTREEKDRLARICFGLFGAGSAIYRRGGWAWPLWLAKQIRRILVREPHEGVWRTYYAPDKTSLRRALSGRGCGYSKTEMIYAPVRRK